MLSKRARPAPANALMTGFTRAMGDVYDAESNPRGIINLGVAENRILLKDVAEKMNSTVNVTPEMLTYQDFTGTTRLRSSVARFINRKFRPHTLVAANELVCLNGVGPCTCMLALAIADPGDGFLVPAPFYGGFHFDMKPAGVVPVPVFTDPAAGFAITLRALEDSYSNSDRPIRGIIVTNPDNPTGRVYTVQEISILLEFATEKQIHVIFDEIYALSMWQRSRGEFESMLSLESVPDPQRTHFMWGLSKDFLGNGLRFAVIHSRNAALIEYVRGIALVSGISSIVDRVVGKMLDDDDWCDDFIAKNELALAKRFDDHVRPFLERLDVPFHEPAGGFFVFVDFRRWTAVIKEKTKCNDKQAEVALWNLWLDSGVYIAPGTAAFSCSEPGWFRIVFSESSVERLELAFRRIEGVLADINK